MEGAKVKFELKAKRPPPAAGPLGGVPEKRWRGDDQQDHDDDQQEGKVQLVQAMDQRQGLVPAEGEAGPPPASGPLVIPLIRLNQWSGAAAPLANVASSPSLVQVPRARTPASTTVPRPSPVQPMPPTSQSAATAPAARSASPLRYGLQLRGKSARPPASDAAPTPAEELPALSVEEEARRALLAGAAGNGDALSMEHLPILALNAVPGLQGLGDETLKVRHDLSLRPPEASMNDYERVPIEAFGKALLLGMGWQEGWAVGRNQSAPVAPKVVAPRPHLLGLGAAPDPATLLAMDKKRGAAATTAKPSTPAPSSAPPVADGGKRSASFAARATKLRVGEEVVVVEGKYRGQKGKLVDLYAKSAGMAAKVEVADGEVLRVWADELERRREPWLRTGLLVYYYGPHKHHHQRKGIVQDVLSRHTCLLRMATPAADLLHDVRDEDLVTVVPRPGQPVLIVKHADRAFLGAQAEVVERDDSSERALLRMEETFQMLRLPYDCICALRPAGS